MSDFLAFGRVYFLPLDPAADRWTFLNGDFSAPQKGRDMPGDAFAIPDERSRRPYVTGRQAIVDAGTYVAVLPAATAILMGPQTPPLPEYVDNFSANPAFGQNALPGAAFDAPYPFYGSQNTLEAVHFRYDQSRSDPYYASFEHHTVGDSGSFVVFSSNAFTQPQKQWTLLGYDPLGPRQSLALTAQLFTVQPGLAQPSSSTAFADMQYVRALRRSSLLLDATQVYDSLLDGSPTPNHPFAFGASWNGFTEQVGKTGFTLRLASGVASVHDALGLGGTSRTDVGTGFLSAVIGSPAIAGPFHSTAYASAAAQQTWLSFPNVVRTMTVSLTDGKQVAPNFYAVASGVVQTAQTDHPAQTFAMPNVATGLTPSPQSPNGLPFLGFATTAPRAIDRTYGLTLSWQPSPAFQLSIAGAHSSYGPGQPFPPSSITLNARASALHSLYIALGRTYYFNWQGQRWSPRFSLQVSGQ